MRKRLAFLHAPYAKREQRFSAEGGGSRPPGPEPIAKPEARSPKPEARWHAVGGPISRPSPRPRQSRSCVAPSFLLYEVVLGSIAGPADVSMHRENGRKEPPKLPPESVIRQHEATGKT